MPIYRHADGGTYTKVEEGSMKLPDGTWTKAVFYRRKGGEMCATTKQRWRERFTKVEN